MYLLFNIYPWIHFGRSYVSGNFPISFNISVDWNVIFKGIPVMCWIVVTSVVMTTFSPILLGSSLRLVTVAQGLRLVYSSKTRRSP